MTAVPTFAAFDPRSHDFLVDPAAALQDTLRETPVFYHPSLDTYYVLPYADVRRVILADEEFSSRVFKTMPVRDDLRERIPAEYERVGELVQGGQVSNMDEPLHTLHRRALQKTFTNRRIKQQQDSMAAMANELIDDFADRGSCDMMRDYAARLTVRVVISMMNVPQELVPGFQEWISSIIGLQALIDLKPEDVTLEDDVLVNAYERAHEAYLIYRDFLEDRRANPGDDLVSAMLAVTDDDGRPAFSADEVLGHMVELTAAGSDTSANIIVNMLRLFTEHPDQLELVQEDPRLWDNAVQEGLRRYAIATSIFRRTKRDTEIAGVTIPAGGRLGLSLAAANADPAMFPEPLRFDVRRPNAGEHLTFGRGRHFCLGATLARPEARIAVQTLYERLPDLKMDVEQPLEFLPALTMRAVTSQRATWTV
jgi:cytochrome P450